MTANDDNVRHTCARETTDAAQIIGRNHIVALLAKYSSISVGELPASKLFEYLDDLRALVRAYAPPPPPPPPPVSATVRHMIDLTPKFQIGDHVCNSDDTDQPVAGIVVGYEVRYTVKQDHLPMPNFGRRGEKLKHAPAAPPAPKEPPFAWTVGSAIDDMKRATLGQSFIADGKELIDSLGKYGLYIVGGPL